MVHLTDLAGPGLGLGGAPAELPEEVAGRAARQRGRSLGGPGRGPATRRTWRFSGEKSEANPKIGCETVIEVV